MNRSNPTTMKTLTILSLLATTSAAFGADGPLVTPFAYPLATNLVMVGTGRVLSVGTQLQRIAPPMMQTQGRLFQRLPSSQSYSRTTFSGSSDYAAESIN